MSTRCSVRFVAASSLAVLFATTGWAETTRCRTIGRLPIMIEKAGSYCLGADYTLNIDNGNAITINDSNVVLDLNGFTIDNLAAGMGTQANAIYANQRSNITIKNGTIRGFVHAVHLFDPAPYATSEGHLIEDIHADHCTYVGIYVAGRRNLVRRNRILSTGGSTTPQRTAGYGIFFRGPGNRAIDNDVITVVATAPSYGYGIKFDADTDNGVAVGNRISEAAYGIDIKVPSVKYRENLTAGVGTAYQGGTDAGGNN
jgi:hypothetical protein